MLKLSKLDVSKRQLEIAIKLYFWNDDPISIHTLTCASLNLLRDLSKKDGGKSFSKDAALDMVKDEYKKYIRGKINEAENYFKHADRDSEDVLDFDPVQTEIFIYDAISMYTKLTGESPCIFKIYFSWYVLNNLEYFNEDYQKQISSVYQFPINDKCKFFKEMLQAQFMPSK